MENFLLLTSRAKYIIFSYGFKTFKISYFLMILIRIFFIILIFATFVGCSLSPGMHKIPQKKVGNEKILKSEYSIDDIKINLIEINNLP